MNNYKNKLLNLGKGLDIPEINTLIDNLSPDEFFSLGQDILNTMKQIIENYHQLQISHKKLEESYYDIDDKYRQELYGDDW